MKFVTPGLLLFLTASGFAQKPNPVGLATGQSARVVIGQPEFDAESDSASDTIIGAVSGLAYANNMLFAVDANIVGAAPVNNRVLIYKDLNTQLPAPGASLAYNTLCPVCVGKANLVLGQPDFASVLPAPCVPPPVTVTVTTTPTTPTCVASSPQTPIATGMRQPTAVASDGKHLVVADTLNNRVLIWNNIPTTNNQAPNVVVGQTSFTSAAFPGSTPNANSLRGPQGVWIQDGKLYVADTLNDRVLIYNSIPTTNGVAADIVLGQPNMTTFVQVNIAAQNTDAAANNMLTPVSVTSDGKHLFVTDLGFNRILIWNSIPTQNQQAADVEIGQPDMTTGIPNDAFTCTENGVAVACGSTPTGSDVILEVPAMCKVTNGIDTNSNPTYPSLCEYTLSFPRFALSDGQHLYVADGGNDRVLIYNSIPTSNAAAANLVLGQVDFVSDQPTDGADTMNAPLSLAWDGSSLYVADTYNQRILVYTTAEQDLPYNGVRNAASLVIYAFGTVTVGGTIKSGDKLTITIGVNTSATTVDYAYTIQSGDDFAAILKGLVALINAKAGDPNVLATANLQANEVVLTARVPGTPGNNVTLATSISSNAEITAAASGTTLAGGASTASVAPGSLVTFLGTNLSDQTASAPTNTTLPLILGGVEVFFNGVRSPLIYVSSTQINAQLPFNFGYSSTATATAWIRIQRKDGSIVPTNTVAITVVPANPGIFSAPCTQTPCNPPPALALHSSSNATAVVSVDGTVKAGNIGSICVGSSDALTATTTVPTGCSGGRLYNYRVSASDSLATIQQAFVSLLNDDPQVTASGSSEFTRILLRARTTGKAGNGIPVQAVVSTGSDLLLTPIGPAPPSPGAGVLLCCANTEGALVTASNPALPGETIIIYATGLGIPSLTPLVDQYLLTGQPYQGPAGNEPQPQSFVSSLIANTTANVLRAELAPGMIGIYQVYLQVSTGITTDRQAPLTIAQGDFVSNYVGLPVFATPLLSSVTCTPTTLTSGATSTCTVLLSVAVPSGATTVTLSSSSNLLTVPASVSVPAGSTSVTFTATEGTVSSSTTATITATLDNTSSNTSITLGP